MVKKIVGWFWAWYERNYALNVTLATGLFILQLVHLYWLTVHVVAMRLTAHSYFSPTGFWEFIIVLVDYTEIPALLGVSLIYIHELRKRWRWSSVLYLLLLNSQWLHIFWITDEFVINQFILGTKQTILPVWLAWVAICIDYLELPVMMDTFRKSSSIVSAWSKRRTS